MAAPYRKGQVLHSVFAAAQSKGQEDLIADFSSISPVHEVESISADGRNFLLHRLVFGARSKKPKWNKS